MPSLGKIFDMMKNLPPQQAAQDINSPDPAKKLAAMMVTNADKQLQQQQAGQQQPMPTIAQKLSQGVTQSPGMPAPPMPAVPPQAQAKPAPQGIAALQPQQTPPGSAMGILPNQAAPEPQSAPVQKASGGIASFASGGQAQQSQQQSQQLAQLMQAINQNSVAQIPQSAQQAGIAAPDPGKANPMQNYATMVFGTRPQVRPGTEAAPISQDLSLSQLGQYSAQQPIAAAHGGLMHHVPDHMYQFKEGGILGFSGNEKQGSQANLSQAQLDAALNQITSNPGIIPGDTFSQAKQAAGNTYTPIGLSSPGEESSSAPPAPPAPNSRNIDPNAINDTANAIMSDPGIAPSNTLAQAAAQAKNTYTPLKLDTGVQPQVRGNVTSPFQGISNFFSNAGTAATNPRLGGTINSPPAPTATNAEVQNNADNLLNNRNALMNGQGNIPTPAQPASQSIIANPLDLQSTGAGADQGNRGISGSSSTPPRVVSTVPGQGIGSLAQGNNKSSQPPAPPPAPPSNNANSLVDDVVKKAALESQKKSNADDELNEQIKLLKTLGINSDAGEKALQRAMEAHQQYKNADDSLERFQRIMSGIAHGGLAGGGAEAANYSAEKRAADYAENRQYMKDLTEAEGATRAEKKEIAANVLKSVEEKNKAANAAAVSMYGHQLTEEGANKRSELERGVQLQIAKLSRDAALANKELTVNDIAKELRNDPKYKDASYADVLTAAFGIKSGLTSKLSSTDLLSRIKLENANAKDFTLSDDERNQAKERLAILNKQLDQTSGLAPAASQYKEGDKSTSKSGKPIIYKNGQWEYV
jgi:hypothetical protein